MLHYIILTSYYMIKAHSDNIHSHHHKRTDKTNTVNKVRNIDLHTITNCTTLYHTYFLLYYKGHIHITYNHTSIKAQTKTIQ